MADEQVIYAVDVASPPEELSALAELLASLDFPLTAISSYEDVDLNTGVTTVLCDTPQEQAAATRRITVALPQWIADGLVGEGVALAGGRTIRREDWSESWKKYFHPFRASRRLVVKPSWEEFTADEGDILLEIDPGMCFGTGSHGTTMGCLRLLDALAAERAADGTLSATSLLDAGCGSGILSMAARRLGFGEIAAFDFDPDAVAVTRENLQRSGIDDVAVGQGDVTTYRPTHPADVVVANILAHILLAAKENLVAMTRPGGILILSGILNEQYPDVQAAFEALGCRETAREVCGDWTTARFAVADSP